MLKVKCVIKAEWGLGMSQCPVTANCQPWRFFCASCGHRLGAERAWRWGTHGPLEGPAERCTQPHVWMRHLQLKARGTIMSLVMWSNKFLKSEIFATLETSVPMESS